MDYVFVPAIYSTQESISVLLSKVLRRSSNCRDRIEQIICNYYLSPCGNKSSQVSPYSICPEDCNAVQMNCDEEWKDVQERVEFKNYQFISCNDTAALLFPLKSCCKRVGLQMQPSATEGDKTIIMYIIFVTVNFVFKSPS